jgi:phenolic acid decarboxylase
MLMVRRKCGRWVHCVNVKTGETISFQINRVDPVGTTFQVTLAIKDDAMHYKVLKQGEHIQQHPEDHESPE